MWHFDENRVYRVRDVRLSVSDQPWAFARRNADAIEAHWQRRLKKNPGFFNGGVFLAAADEEAESEALSAHFLPSDFKSFLYWREHGWPDPAVSDAFGSALIFTQDGRLLCGLQGSGHLNSGLCYPPGGFIDAGDVDGDGAINIEASVAREIAEELGLTPEAHLERVPGFIVTRSGPVLSIGVTYVSRLDENSLLAAIARHIASDPNPELARVVLLEPGPVPATVAMPDYAKVLIEHLPRITPSA